MPAFHFYAITTNFLHCTRLIISSFSSIKYKDWWKSLQPEFWILTSCAAQLRINLSGPSRGYLMTLYIEISAELFQPVSSLCTKVNIIAFYTSTHTSSANDELSATRDDTRTGFLGQTSKTIYTHNRSQNECGDVSDFNCFLLVDKTDILIKKDCDWKNIFLQYMS